MTKKTFNSPDETRNFPKGKVELVTVGSVKFGRLTLDPGWKWSVHVQPTAKTKSCEAPTPNTMLRAACTSEWMTARKSSMAPAMWVISPRDTMLGSWEMNLSL